LLKVTQWHWIFAIVSLPGLLIALRLWRALRDAPLKDSGVHAATGDLSKHSWSDVFAYRNIRLNIIGILCWMTCVVVLSTFFPSYLIDYLHLSIDQMGFVLSGTVLVERLACVTMPTLSDWVGRKPVMILSVIGALVFVILLSRTGAQPLALFAYPLLALACVFSLITLTVGPLSTECVPVSLMSTAGGMVVGIGKIFGGGVAPALAGYVMAAGRLSRKCQRGRLKASTPATSTCDGGTPVAPGVLLRTPYLEKFHRQVTAHP
jgi:fucose permease